MDVWVVVEYTDNGDFYVNSVWADANEARKAAKHRMELECVGLMYHQIDVNTWECEMENDCFRVEVIQRYLRH